MEHIYDDCGKTDITKLTAKDIENVCYKMQIGEIKWKTSKGERVYKSTRDYIKIFKDFWHWYMRDQREQNKEIPDITLNLANDTQTESEFVYTTLEDTTKLIDNAKPYYKTQIAFQFDTGIRSPSELMNIRKKDFSYINKQDIWQKNNINNKR